MYEDKRISIKSFQENHSFSFIEDKKTILDVTNELLGMPLDSVFHPIWSSPNPKAPNETFSPEKFLEKCCRHDLLLPENCCSLSGAGITYAESLALLSMDLHLPRKRRERESWEMPNELLRMYTGLYLGYQKKERGAS